MPQPEVAGLNEYATLWAYASTDNYGGITVNSPAEIVCKWEDTKSGNQNPLDSDQGYDAIVFVKSLPAMDSILTPVRLRSLPDTPTELYQVKNQSRITDIRGRVSQYKLMLKRYTKTLPTVV